MGAEDLERCFTLLLGCCATPHGAIPSYNMLLTRQHMVMVPRRSEYSGPVGINSVGFAGSFFVRSQEELDYVRTVGPMHILAQVGEPW